MNNTEPEVLNADSSRLKAYAAAAIELVMTMAGEKKVEVAIVIGDAQTHELMLSGHCCPGCTATLIQAAMHICEGMEQDGTIEPVTEEKPN